MGHLTSTLDFVIRRLTFTPGIMLSDEHYFCCWSQMIPKTQRGDHACQSHTQPRHQCGGKSTRILLEAPGAVHVAVPSFSAPTRRTSPRTSVQINKQQHQISRM